MVKPEFIDKPSWKGNDIRRVGMIFSGGPAPGANAVISAAAVSFLDTGRTIIGLRMTFYMLQCTLVV